jgi:hypothetical protein
LAAAPEKVRGPINYGNKITKAVPVGAAFFCAKKFRSRKFFTAAEFGCVLILTFTGSASFPELSRR